VERALLAPIYWNLAWDRKRSAPTLPVSKSWAGMVERIMEAGDGRGRGPLVFNWDAALAAMSLAPFDATLAVELLNGLLSYQRKDGAIPHLVVGDRRTNLANPPVIFLACMKAYLHVQNPRLLRDWSALTATRRLIDHRTGSAEGRMAWGAPSADPVYPGLVGKVGAAYESGMDDSPTWEGGLRPGDGHAQHGLRRPHLDRLPAA
jgi:hypothetical protein